MSEGAKHTSPSQATPDISGFRISPKSSPTLSLPVMNLSCHSSVTYNLVNTFLADSRSAKLAESITKVPPRKCNKLSQPLRAINAVSNVENNDSSNKDSLSLQNVENKGNDSANVGVTSVGRTERPASYISARKYLNEPFLASRHRKKTMFSSNPALAKEMVADQLGPSSRNGVLEMAATLLKMDVKHDLDLVLNNWHGKSDRRNYLPLIKVRISVY